MGATCLRSWFHLEFPFTAGGMVTPAPKLKLHAVKAILASDCGGMNMESTDFKLGLNNKIIQLPKLMNPTGKVQQSSILTLIAFSGVQSKVLVLEDSEGSTFENNAVTRYVAQLKNFGIFGSSAYEEGGRLKSQVGHLVDPFIRRSQLLVHTLDMLSSKQEKSRSSVSKKQTGNGGATKAAQGNAKNNKVEEREVQCDVETVSWRERHISASVSIEASEERVWEVLTDYERLAEFIPNLVRSERIPCPHPGRIWLLQEGRQAAMYWHIEARVVLDLLELPDVKDGKELRFSMVDGDFKRYVGRWYLRPSSRPGVTVLHYEVNVTPRLLFPAAFVERIIRTDLPTNLRAMAARAEGCITLSQGSTYVPSSATVPLLLPSSVSKKMEDGNLAVHSAGGSSVVAPQRLSDDESTSSSVCVGLKEKTTWSERDYIWGAVGKTCKLGKPCAVDEVHLRRFDDLLENGGVHRRVVAAITVEAPMQNVWTVLTSYKNLPEFIPNLEICEVLSRDKNRVRLLQEGCKCLLYMVLHARVVLDLWERPQHEILFQQVEGDFDSFQGKWTLEPLGTQHTLLKYLVDTKMHKDSLLAEAMVEEVIYEDLPANLCAIRDRVELLELESLQGSEQVAAHTNEKKEEEIISGENSGVSQESCAPIAKALEDASKAVDSRGVWRGPKPFPRTRRRPLVEGLQRDFNVLEKELLKFISEQGTEGVMPMRCELRECGRVDLEKAISRMGGFGPVASKLNLSLAYKERKPRGYWDNIQNIHMEIMKFQIEHSKDRKHMPTRKSLERAGRYDLARALEKWGGLQEVARFLGLQVRKRQSTRSGKLDLMPAQSGKAIVEDENHEPDLQLPLKTMLPLKSTKWITLRRSSGLESNEQ